MEKVTGIGGLLFRAHDPAALGRWYQQHLGVTLAPSSYEASVWQQEAGPTVFSSFAETSDYFGISTRCGWSTFVSGISTEWQPSYERRESRSRLTRSLIPTAASPACTTLKEIRLNKPISSGPTLACQAP